MSRLKHSIDGLFYDYHSKTIREFRISQRKPKVRRPEVEGTTTGIRVSESAKRPTSCKVNITDLDNPNFTSDIKRIFNIDSLVFSYGCYLYDQRAINCTLLFYWLNHQQTVMIALPGSPGSAFPERHIRKGIGQNFHDKEKSFVRSHIVDILRLIYGPNISQEICLVWQ